MLWGFIRKYEPGATPETNPDLAAAVQGAIRYFQTQVLPKRRFAAPDAKQAAALFELQCRLWFWQGDVDAEKIQSVIYAIGKKHGFEPLRDWFRTIYEVLFGTSQGPRMGGFVEIYGTRGTAGLISSRLRAAAPGMHLTEADLILPALLFLDSQPDGSASIRLLKNEFQQLLGAAESDAEDLPARADSGFAELVGRFFSAKDDVTGIFGSGCAECLDDPLGMKVTNKGRRFASLELS